VERIAYCEWGKLGSDWVCFLDSGGGIEFGLGLNWVCFFGVGRRLFLRNSFWGKGLDWFWCFWDWVCFA